MQSDRRNFWWLTFGSMAAFAVLSAMVHVRLMDEFDRTMAMWVYSSGVTPLDYVMNALTMIGAPDLNCVMAVALGLVLWRRSDWRAAAWLIGVFVVATLLEIAMKYGIEQPGPGQFSRHVFHRIPIIDLHLPFAYPSGHTLRTVFLGGIMARLVAPRAAWLWWLLAVTIAFSRVYLGAHWTTDVLGGLLLGLASLFVLELRFRSLLPATTR